MRDQHDSSLKMPPLPNPLLHATFNLNSAGVAGFFGGEEAISAMATVHLFKGRRWLGWFNSPGSYTVAKRFGRMANSRFWDGLFPGSNDSPAVTFGLDSNMGPQYIAALSGTTMHAGHLAYLTMERIKELDEDVILGRVTNSFDVAYLNMKKVNLDAPVELQPLQDALFGLLPITVSVVACVICALVYDWISFSMILIGIISSGLASLVIGKGRLVLKSTKPAPGAPPGHGLLMGEGEMVVIKGEEQDVNVITKGHFDLKTGDEKDSQAKGSETKSGAEKDNETKGSDERSNDGESTGKNSEKGGEVKCNWTNGDVEKGDKKNSTKEDDEKKKKKKKKGAIPSYHMIGISSLLLLVQFLLQLLLVPQGSLFGQIMFLVSLGISWAYTSYLSSLEKEKIQIKVLFEALGNPKMLRFRTGTRTTMAVFVCLLVFHGVKRCSDEKDRMLRLKLLDKCIPNDTAVWKRWKDKVVQQLLSIDDASKSSPSLVEDEDYGKFPEGGDRKLLEVLLKDADAAFSGYFRVRDELHGDSTDQSAT